MSERDAAAAVTELLQQMIRNQCVNDGTPESGHEVRNADLLQSYLEGSGIDIGALERCDGPCKMPPTGGTPDGEEGGCCGAGNGVGSGALVPVVLGLLLTVVLLA